MFGYIFNLQRFSIHDGPGIRTTVFFQGCPLQCIWCHNPEGIPSHISVTGKEVLNGIRKYTVDGLFEEIMKDKVFFEESAGGITFSGGEPLMQAEFLIKILQKLKDQGIHTAIDTSGYAPSDIFQKVVSITDLVLFDLKIAETKKHKTYTGTDNDIIHQNLRYLLHSDIPMRIRVPLVNNITADNQNIAQLQKLLTGRNRIDIDLLSYHDLGKGKREKMGMGTNGNKLSAPESERLEEIRRIFDPDKFTVNLGG